MQKMSHERELKMRKVTVEENPQDAARGIAFGCLIGATLWMIILLVGWFLVSK
jgi:hypothetical protein